MLAVSAILAWATARLHRPNQIAGLLLVGVAAGVLLILEWRNQRRIARLDFTVPSLPFVREAIDRLKAHSNPAFYELLLRRVIECDMLLFLNCLARFFVVRRDHWDRAAV